VTGDADRGTTVSDTVREGTNVLSLVEAGQTTFVTLTVGLDVLKVLGLKLGHLGEDVLHTLAVGKMEVLDAEVGVATSTVPVTVLGLGVKVDGHAEELTDAVEGPATDPELISSLNTDDGTDLELPLSGHDLSVSARDTKTGVEKSVKVGISDLATVCSTGSVTAVVRALRSGVTMLGETKMGTVVEEGVLLLESKHGLVLLGDLLKDGIGGSASVGLDGLSGIIVGIAHHDECIVVGVEGVRVHGLGLENDLRVVSGSLVRGRTIIVPEGKISGAGRLLGSDLDLGTDVLASTTDPDILQNGLVRRKVVEDASGTSVEPTRRSVGGDAAHEGGVLGDLGETREHAG